MSDFKFVCFRVKIVLNSRCRQMVFFDEKIVIMDVVENKFIMNFG